MLLTEACQGLIPEVFLQSESPRECKISDLEFKVYKDMINKLNKNFDKLKGTSYENYLDNHVFPKIIKKKGTLPEELWTPDIATFISTFNEVSKTGANAIISNAEVALESRLIGMENSGPCRGLTRLYFMVYKSAELLGNTDLMRRAKKLIDGY